MEDFELKTLQNAARAVNKQLARTLKHPVFQKGNVQEAFDTYVGEFATKSGRFKAGAKFISELSGAELENYISSISSLRVVINTIRAVDAFEQTLDTGNKENIWKIKDYLVSRGTSLPSDMLWEIIDEDLTDAQLDDLVVFLAELSEDSSIGLAEFQEEYEKLVPLENRGKYYAEMELRDQLKAARKKKRKR